MTSTSRKIRFTAIITHHPPGPYSAPLTLFSTPPTRLHPLPLSPHAVDVSKEFAPKTTHAALSTPSHALFQLSTPFDSRIYPRTCE